MRQTEKDEMKRKELAVGLEVEVQTGTTYKSFSRAIVVDTQPWSDVGGSWTSRLIPARKGSGVAVAVENRWAGASVVTWTPDVVQLSKLVPVGTAVAEREREDAERALRQEAAERRGRDLVELRRRVGVEAGSDLDFRYSQWGGQVGYYDASVVEIRRSVLERLLDELESYRGRSTDQDREAEDRAEVDAFTRELVDDGSDG